VLRFSCLLPRPLVRIRQNFMATHLQHFRLLVFRYIDNLCWLIVLVTFFFSLSDFCSIEAWLVAIFFVRSHTYDNCLILPPSSPRPSAYPMRGFFSPHVFWVLSMICFRFSLLQKGASEQEYYRTHLSTHVRRFMGSSPSLVEKPDLASVTIKL